MWWFSRDNIAVPSTLPESLAGVDLHGRPPECTFATTGSGFCVPGHDVVSEKYVESPTRGCTV
jgi:hypothetical protein